MASSQSNPQEFETYSSGNTEGPPELRFLHYNDVYHVDASSAEPVGGFARFKTVCNYYRTDSRFKSQPELLTFFSGDAFNPSLESSVTKGPFVYSMFLCSMLG
jgi:5'-nucleotidase